MIQRRVPVSHKKGHLSSTGGLWGKWAGAPLLTRTWEHLRSRWAWSRFSHCLSWEMAQKEGLCIYYNGSQCRWAESRPGWHVCGLWRGIEWKVPQGSSCLETEMDCCWGFGSGACDMWSWGKEGQSDSLADCYRAGGSLPGNKWGCRQTWLSIDHRLGLVARLNQTPQCRALKTTMKGQLRAPISWPSTTTFPHHHEAVWVPGLGQQLSKQIWKTELLKRGLNDKIWLSFLDLSKMCVDACVCTFLWNFMEKITLVFGKYKSYIFLSTLEYNMRKLATSVYNK